jgi:hypothetical protein
LHHTKEISGGYTDHHDRYSIENRLHADDRSVGTEVFFGKSIGQNNRQLRLPWGVIITLAKESTGGGGNTENGKEIIGDKLKAGSLRETAWDLKNGVTDPGACNHGSGRLLPQPLVRGIGKEPLRVEWRFYCVERIEL